MLEFIIYNKILRKFNEEEPAEGINDACNNLKYTIIYANNKKY